MTWEVPKSGILAFACSVVQLPWAYVALMVGLSLMAPSPFTRATPPPAPSLMEVALYRLMVIFPSIAGFALGCYSVKVAKTRRRNALGLIGLLLSAIVVIPTALGFSIIVDWLPYPVILFFNWLNR